MSKLAEKIERQLELARAKIKTILLDPEVQTIEDSKVVVVALMAVAAEIAMYSVEPEAARKFMVGAINCGFDNVEYPVMQEVH